MQQLALTFALAAVGAAVTSACGPRPANHPPASVAVSAPTPVNGAASEPNEQRRRSARPPSGIGQSAPVRTYGRGEQRPESPWRTLTDRRFP